MIYGRLLYSASNLASITHNGEYVIVGFAAQNPSSPGSGAYIVLDDNNAPYVVPVGTSDWTVLDFYAPVKVV